MAGDPSVRALSTPAHGGRAGLAALAARQQLSRRETPMSINRRSKNITEGVARAPNRSMYYAMGYTEATSASR
jgi:hypothetical protein